jgi:hypothetical protein
MRKSIATAHNLITGEFTEMEKVKPSDAGYRALGKIELFKAETGELVREVLSENFVSVTWDDYQKAVARMLFFVRDVYNDGGSYKYYFDNSSLLDDNQENYTPIFGESFPAMPSPFSSIYLTDYTATERPLTERAIFGNILGYAGREVPYSGASTTQGSFNSAESFKKLADKQFHFVWDFPTHAGNGTFQSLYWASATDNPEAITKEMELIVTLPNGYTFNTSDARGVVYKNNKLYLAVKTPNLANKAIAVFDVDLSAKTITPDPVQPIIDLKGISGSTPLVGFGFMSDGSVITKAYNQVVQRFAPATGLPIALPNGNMSFEFPGSYDQYTQIYVDGVNDLLYMNFGARYSDTANEIGNNTGQGSYLVCLSLANMSQAKTNIKFLANDYYASAYLIPHLNHNSIHLDPYTVIDTTGNALLAKYKANDLRRIIHTSPNFLGGVLFDGQLGEPQFFKVNPTQDSINGLVTLQNVGRIGGRNLLPEPVIKTNEFTMKITYDLFFE